MVFLVSLVVYYSLWIGVQLPQGKYVSYSRGYILVSLASNIGYTTGSLTYWPYTPTPTYYYSIGYPTHTDTTTIQGHSLVVRYRYE